MIYLLEKPFPVYLLPLILNLTGVPILIGGLKVVLKGGLIVVLKGRLIVVLNGGLIVVLNGGLTVVLNGGLTVVLIGRHCFPILFVPLGQLAGLVTHFPFTEICPFGQLTGLVTHFPFTEICPFGQLAGLVTHFPFTETCPFGQLAGLGTHFPFTETSPSLHSLKHLPFFCVWPLGHLQTPLKLLPPMHSLTHSSPFNLSPGL